MGPSVTAAWWNRQRSHSRRVAILGLSTDSSLTLTAVVALFRPFALNTMGKSATLVWCSCCNRLVSRGTRWNHMKGKSAPPRIQAAALTYRQQVHEVAAPSARTMQAASRSAREPQGDSQDVSMGEGQHEQEGMEDDQSDGEEEDAMVEMQEASEVEEGPLPSDDEDGLTVRQPLDVLMCNCSCVPFRLLRMHCVTSRHRLADTRHTLKTFLMRLSCRRIRTATSMNSLISPLRIMQTFPIHTRTAMTLERCCVRWTSVTTMVCGSMRG